MKTGGTWRWVGAFLLLIMGHVCAQESIMEEHYFDNAGVKLYAQVFLPAHGDELAGLVLIQGSGESGTSNRWARQIAETFSGLGYAVLLPDKRGVGHSEGDWRSAGFETLAADAVASLRMLQQHPRVSPDHVGFVGLSQGGHIAPLAAQQVTGIAFVVNVVGSLTTMEEQLYHELRNTYLQHGLDADTIEYLQTLTRLSFDYLRDPGRWPEYLARRSEIAAGPLGPAVESWPDKESDPYWVFWREIYEYDPMPLWRELVVKANVPSLVLFGEEDESDNVPVLASKKRAAELLSDPDFTLRVYPDTGHALYAPGTHRLLPEVVAETHAWLRESLAR